jgi:hypothetical protein
MFDKKGLCVDGETGNQFKLTPDLMEKYLCFPPEDFKKWQSR